MSTSFGTSGAARSCNGSLEPPAPMFTPLIAEQHARLGCILTQISIDVSTYSLFYPLLERNYIFPSANRAAPLVVLTTLERRGWGSP